MRYIAFLLFLFPMLGFAKQPDSSHSPLPACSDVMAQIRLAAEFVGSSNYVAQFDKGKEAHLILFLQQPSPSNDSLRWRLIERQDESSSYCVIGQGKGLELLQDAHLSNPNGKYGMPGSGYPRCAGKQVAGLPGSLDIRLWANREIGNSLIYDLRNQMSGKDFIAMFSTEGVGAWVILDVSRGNLDDSCYYDRGETSKLFQDFNAK